MHSIKIPTFIILSVTVLFQSSAFSQNLDQPFYSKNPTTGKVDTKIVATETLMRTCTVVDITDFKSPTVDDYLLTKTMAVHIKHSNCEESPGGKFVSHTDYWTNYIETTIEKGLVTVKLDKNNNGWVHANP